MIRILKMDKRFQALSFVTKAAAKENTHFAIDRIKADKDHIIATDGRRLHYIPNKELLPPGLYEVIKANKTEIILHLNNEGRFPSSWLDIVPKHKKFVDIFADRNALAYVIYNLGVFVNPDYIRDIFPGNQPDKFRLWFEDGTKPILIECGEHKAVMMIISVPDYTIEKPQTLQDA